ncbi:MAG: hypothetical protein L6W00_00600 [Lentisphaeria bacterium]|nr:MAG: hypothetical protein L6W00_00600 [Lentisphaeria bacterium]
MAATAREAAQNAVKAERERISAIQAICDGEFPEIEREAIAGGWTPEVVTKKVLETIRAERPAANVNISVKTAPEGGELRKTIEAAMCLRVGVSADQLEKSYGAKTVGSGDGRNGHAAEAASDRMYETRRHSVQPRLRQ